MPKPFVSVEPTGPSVYRTVDREHPTLIIDEADDLFYRKSDLRAIRRWFTAFEAGRADHGEQLELHRSQAWPFCRPGVR